MTCIHRLETPRAAFRAIAEDVGLKRSGDPMDQNLVDFATRVVNLCAAIADAYGDEESGGNASEHIRPELHDRTADRKIAPSR